MVPSDDEQVPSGVDGDGSGPAGTQAAANAPGPREDIMQATYRALCSQGYADLTMQDIADEAPVSKAALHYHYDSKRGLLSAFQAYLSEQFISRIRAADDPDADPPERLSAVLDAALVPPADDERCDVQRALLELKAQAPYESDFRAHIRRTDETFRELVTDILATGVEAGAFDATVDPESTAQFVATVIGGNQVRQVSVGQSPERTRALLAEQVEARITTEREAE